MKTKPELKIINLELPAKGEVREHLDESVKRLFACEGNPVVGYAIVIFHESKAHGTSFHLTKTGIHQLDMPEMVKNRLLAHALRITS